MAEIPSARAGFLRRLAYYAIGLAIGFMLLGMFQRLRTQEHDAREAARLTREAAMGATPGTGTVPPTAPPGPAGPLPKATESGEAAGSSKTGANPLDGASKGVEPR